MAAETKRVWHSYYEKTTDMGWYCRCTDGRHVDVLHGTDYLNALEACAEALIQAFTHAPEAYRITAEAALKTLKEARGE